ncbi:hypothetical protein RV06_GL001636 [Enterococcus haemoperoxidus]|nr:hypothetical protein RV06_GL001636 [Enterococcus haemoperoxidus]
MAVYASDITVKTERKTKISRVYEIPANGDIGIRRNNEGRKVTHTDFEPTGIFVKKGEQLSITLNKGSETEIVIGQYGSYSYLNNNQEVDFYRYFLQPGENKIISKNGDGMVYFVNHSESELSNISVEGGSQVPMYVLGKTTKEQWEKQWKDNSEAPFVEFVGNYVFATYQADLARGKEVKEIDTMLESWDQVYIWQNEVMGLLEENTGLSKKYSNRVHITTPDKGGGYAYATNGRLGFQKETNAAEDLLRDHSTWALWHEMGHTYQNPYYQFYNTGEVTVNIPALYIQKKMGLPDRWQQEPYKIEEIRNYLNNQDPNKTIDFPHENNDTGLWIRLAMFDQLARGFGDNFYPRLNQEYRVLTQSNQINPKTEEEKKQYFMVISSSVVNRNLFEFFDKWGMKPTKETLEKMKKYPPLEKAIWKNIIEESVTEYDLPMYSVPQGVPKKVILTAGEKILSSEISSYYDSWWNSTFNSNEVTLDDIQFDTNSPNTAYLKTIIKNDTGVKELYEHPIEFNYGNAVSFRGYGNKERAVLTLQKETKKIKTVSNSKDTSPIDSGNKQYAEVTIYKNNQLEEVKKVTVNTIEAPFEFAKSLSDISYENGYYIKVSMYRDKHLEGYTEGEKMLAVEESEKQEWFKIVNDQLVRLNAAPKIHLKAQLPTVYVGEQLETNDFIEKIDDEFDVEKVETSFEQQPDTTTVGEHKTTLIAKNIVGNETRLSVRYSVVYGNALSLRAYLPSDERVVIRLDNERSELITFANPNRDTVLASGEGMIWQIVLKNGENGKEKIKLSANKEEKPFDFAKKLNHTRFNEGDLVELLHTSGGEFVKNYKQNEKTKDGLSKENTFVITNGQFVFVTNGKPTIESLNKVVYEKGQKVTEDQFIKDIQLKTEEGNRISTNFEPTWLEKVGNYDSTVTVENPMNHQKVSKQVSICVQDTTPPIITGDKEIEYPLYADVTEQKLFKDLGIKTDKPATLTSNFSRKMLEKEGIYKIEVIAEDFYGNKSEPFLIDLKVTGIHATHTFKKGYWESYGLILNGQVKMLGVDLSKKEAVVKTLELMDESGKVAATIPTVNTNWYTPGQYDGYQATLSAKTIAAVQSGTYKLQVKVKVKDGEEIIAPITVNNQAMFSIQDYQDVFLDIPTNNIGLKTIKTMSKDGQSMLEVTMSDTPVMGLISEGQAKEGRFVNGYVLNTDFDFSQKHQKNLVIEDKSGKVVKELKNIHTWDLTSWNLGIAGLDMKSGFQVIIPNEYQNTSLYQYKLQVVTGEEEALQLEVALDKII